ncbi:glycosyltransferase family 4 protein [Roseivivax isoporae]|uniref:Glycosyl transferase family 1 n=1 Tax=Roseivivax isoporae LMG 25204 TaxID=1449351 RepID=X7FAE7_9RHOB|nr:glycosyltransferase family 4 protein [Roseivivax isoporae]ETX29024.1 hypothetical protein RISW2_03525 [Roseivivax isoporae LMG 25204]
MTLDAVGGVWRHSVDLAEGFQARGAEVVLAGFGPEPVPEQRAEAERVATLVWAPEPLDWMAAVPEELAGVGHWIATEAARRGATHVWLNVPSQAADLPRIPGDPTVIAMSHSCLGTWYAEVLDEPVPGPVAWLSALTRAGLERADVVLAPSRSHADALARTYPGLDGIAAVWNATVAPEAPAATRSGVIAAGRWWDLAKNARCLDLAAAELDVPVTLLGAVRGPEGSVAQIRHAQAVGNLPARAARRMVSEAEVFVSASHYEPFGLAVLEAASGGAPLVLSDIATFRELWDGVALFFDPRDPDALVARISEVRGDPGLARAMGAHAAERAARFSRAAQLDAIEDLLWPQAGRGSGTAGARAG